MISYGSTVGKYIDHIQLCFHPFEKSFPTNINQSVTNVYPGLYISSGYEKIFDKDYEVVTVSLYFDDNFAQGVGSWCCPTSQMLGYHKHDIEYISFYCCDDGIDLIYFSAHSRGQGTWVSWNECEITPDNKLVVYVSLNSHALYPHPRTYWRVFGFANDYCSKYGAKQEVDLNDIARSYDFSFDNGIRLYKSLRPSPSPVSITSWERFCLPFYLKQIKSR